MNSDLTPYEKGGIVTMFESGSDIGGHGATITVASAAAPVTTQPGR